MARWMTKNEAGELRKSLHRLNRMPHIRDSDSGGLPCIKVTKRPTNSSREPKSEGRFSQAIYYFYPDDVETLHTKMHQSGLAVTDLTTRFYGMREFEMLDPSGHVLVFGQETSEKLELEERRS